MARSIEYIQLMTERYKMFQALSIEDWAAQNGMEPSYPPGVNPSSVQAETLEVLETIWIRETPPE